MTRPVSVDEVSAPLSGGAGRAWFSSRSSSRQRAVVAVLAGLTCGVGWWLAAVGVAPRLLLRYLAQSTFRPESAQGFVEVFGGRGAGFLIQQGLVRVGVSLAVAFLVAGCLRGRDERASAEGRFLRGVQIRDLGREERRGALRAVFFAVLVGCAAGLLATVAVLGSGARGAPDLFTAWLVPRSSVVAFLFGTSSEPPLIWCDGLLPPGLYLPAEAYARLEAVLGVSALELMASGLLKSAVVGGLVWFGLWRWDGLRARRQGEGGYRLAGVCIPPGKECYHVLVTGSPGSGKSTAIKELLDQIRERGERAVVYDLSGEYVELFYREGTDKLLNPLDARTENWNIWAEVRESADFDTLARSLFPSGGAEPFWADASAVLFASVARALEGDDQRRNDRLYEALTARPIEDLRELLQETPAARLLDPAAGAMPSNLIATVTSRLQAWSLLPEGEGDEAFSIRDFLEREGDGWLFLSTGERHAQVLKPLLSLWADLAATTLLSRPGDGSRRTFCVLDEVASLQRLPALPGLLERGRKHGTAVVLGLQAMPQLREAYGRELAAAIAAQPQTWLVLRTVEPDTAKWLESALGQSELQEVQESYSMGTVGGASTRDSVAATERIVQRPVAMASEISSLPDHHGFLKLPGGRDVYRVVSRPKPRMRLAAAFETSERRQESLTTRAR